MHVAALSRLDVDSDYVRILGSAYRRVGRYETDYYSLARPVAGRALHLSQGR